MSQDSGESKVGQGIVIGDLDEHVDEIVGTDATEFLPMLLEEDVLVQARLRLFELPSGEPSSATGGVGPFLAGFHVAGTTFLGLLSNLFDGRSLGTHEHELLETENEGRRPVNEQPGRRRVRVG